MFPIISVSKRSDACYTHQSHLLSKYFWLYEANHILCRENIASCLERNGLSKIEINTNDSRWQLKRGSLQLSPNNCLDLNMDPKGKEKPPANLQMCICSFKVFLGRSFTVISLSLPVCVCTSCQLECPISLLSALSDHPWLRQYASPIKTHYNLRNKDNLTWCITIISPELNAFLFYFQFVLLI